MSVVIDVNKVGKLYRLGEIGTGTLSHDLKRWWATTRGREDPFAKIGTLNDRTKSSIRNEYVWALKDISFQVNRGEVVGVIGKNGAGKSTLLKILSRITAPSAGSVKIKGRVGSLLEVGTGFHPEMTGRENVFMNGTILGMTRGEITRKFDDIVDFAGVAKYIDTPVKRYSSGMMVRLGFAVAAFLEPEILIVDEVLAVGDVEFQKKALGRMQDVSKNEGRTVLFVSHNMGSIKNLCKSGIVLSRGSICFNGNIDKAISEYISETSTGEDEIPEVLAEEDIQFCALDLLDIKMKSSRLFKSNDDIVFVLEFKILRLMPPFRIVFKVFDRFDNIVFCAVHNYSMTREDIGRNISSECMIKRNLFNNGTYFLQFNVGIPGQSTLMKQVNKTEFQIEYIGIDGSHFNNNLPGIVAPVFDWKFTSA